MAQSYARGSLIVIGTGLHPGHVTPEALAYLRRTDDLLYLVGDKITLQWILELNPRAESLSISYAVGKPRRETYSEMLERILALVRSGRQVCVALYGHPGVGAVVGHAAVLIATQEGHSAKMLPAVSSLDCMFADLGIDPLQNGLQSYEATNFLIRRRVIDPRAGLVLLQVGMLGQSDFRMEYADTAIPLLVEVLTDAYGANHSVVLYEAAIHPICSPVVMQMSLGAISQAKVTPSMTLYVPALAQEGDQEMLSRLAALF